ncbi:MAG: universal stress protein [Thermoplasmatota archaeon]
MYDKIIVPTDGSEFSMKGVKEGIELASALNIPVHAVYVIEVGDIRISDKVISHFEDEAAETLNKVEDLAEKMGAKLEKKTFRGTPYKKITEYASENDIIYMASHGHSGFRDLFMGSTTERVLKKANCTVAVVKGKEE